MVLNRVICRLSPKSTNVVMKRSFQYGIPNNRISLGEKGALFGIAMVIIAGPMFWIMANIKKYQGKE